MTKVDQDPLLSEAHLPALDLVRGIAIVAVIAYHLVVNHFPSGWWHTGAWPLTMFGTWATNGWLGVNLFFIVSGFVLYLPYATRSRTLGNVSDVAAFYKRRSRRLLPLFYLSTCFLIAISPSPWPRQELLLLTFTFNFNADTFLPGVNFVLWSLGVEVWFSLLFPFIVIAIERSSWVVVGTVIFVAAMAMRMIGAPTDESVVGHTVPYINPMKDSVIGRLDDFFVGMALAAVHARGFRCAIPRTALTAGLLICTGAAVVVDLSVERALPWMAMAFSNVVFQAGVVAVMMAAMARPSLRLRPLELLGMMCYSLYIWHGVIIKHASADTGAGLARVLVLLAGVAWLSYRYVEFGHIKEVSRLLPKRRTRPEEIAGVQRVRS